MHVLYQNIENNTNGLIQKNVLLKIQELETKILNLDGLKQNCLAPMD